MSKVSEEKYIRRRMLAEFKLKKPNIPIGFENDNFKPPENQVYGEFYILGGKGQAIGGSNGHKVINRYPGIVQVTFYSPKETGTVEATSCVDVVAKIFEHHRGRCEEGDVITFKAAEFPKMGNRGGWDVQIVKIPFYRDEEVPVS